MFWFCVHVFIAFSPAYPRTFVVFPLHRVRPHHRGHRVSADNCRCRCSCCTHAHAPPPHTHTFTQKKFRPHQGIPRLVTSSRSSRSSSLVRRGLAFMIEHGFYNTDQGRESFALNLKQITDAVHTTCYSGEFWVIPCVFFGYRRIPLTPFPQTSCTRFCKPTPTTRSGTPSLVSSGAASRTCTDRNAAGGRLSPRALVDFTCSTRISNPSSAGKGSPPPHGFG